MSEFSVLRDHGVDLHAVIEADGSVSVDDLPVPADGGDPEAAVLATAADLAEQLGHPVIAAISDLRPGGHPQRHRVRADGGVERVRPGELREDAGGGPDGAGPGPETLYLDPRAEGRRPGPAADSVETAASTGAGEAPRPAAARAPREPLPTVHDLLGGRAAGELRIPAQQGWRRGVRRASGGLFSPGPGRAERAARAARRAVQKPLDGPRTIVVVNPKGGAHKTTAALLLAAAFGTCRGGSTLAWDNNESRGTLGWRSRPAPHERTAVDLLAEADRIAAAPQAGVGHVDAFVRAQGDARFDVLASDESADSGTLMDGPSYHRLHTLLRRFYRILIVDTGNNMRADNWAAAVGSADALVVVSTLREDTAASAAWMIDALRATGHEQRVARAVTVLSDSGPRPDRALADRLAAHFRRHTRAVVRVPYDPALVSGGRTAPADLLPGTRAAWLFAAAAVAEGL